MDKSRGEARKETWIGLALRILKIVLKTFLLQRNKDKEDQK